MPFAAIEEAFRTGDHETPPRQHIPIGDADLLFMPSWNPRFAGVKLVTVNPSNPERDMPLIHGSYLLFERENMQPVALIDASALTALRTAAVSGAATRALAAPRARRLVIFGSGVQAHSHLEAMIEVRKISELAVVPRTEESGNKLLAHARSLGVNGTLAYAGEAVSSADIDHRLAPAADPTTARAEATAREEGKPDAALPKIVDGRVNGFYKEVVLLEQSSVQDSKKTVKQQLDEAGVTVKRFVRFEVGQA